MPIFLCVAPVTGVATGFRGSFALPQRKARTFAYPNRKSQFLSSSTPFTRQHATYAIPSLLLECIPCSRVLV